MNPARPLSMQIQKQIDTAPFKSEGRQNIDGLHLATKKEFESICDNCF